MKTNGSERLFEYFVDPELSEVVNVVAKVLRSMVLIIESSNIRSIAVSASI